MTARRITSLLFGAVLMVAGLATSASAGSPAPAHLVGGNSAGKHLFVVGDSITDLTATDLTKALKRYSYVIDATVGITMAKSLPTIEQAVASTPPQYWVIELGTNDLNNPNIERDFTNEVNAVSRQKCVVLVTPSRLTASLQTLDQHMMRLAATDPIFHVLDWGAIEYENPHWVFTDAVHPSIKGQVKLASLERRILKADCRY